MKFFNLIFLFIFYFNNLNAFENHLTKIKDDLNLIYKQWNQGGYDKYENIFRRDNENAFNTCVAVSCGAGLLEQYNQILFALQEATGHKTGVFGKKFTYEEYQEYKNLYFEQKTSSSSALTNTKTFLIKFNNIISSIEEVCKLNPDVANIRNAGIDSLDKEILELDKEILKKDNSCTNLFLKTEKNLKIAHLELSNLRILLDYSLNENHNNSLKKSSKLLTAYNDEILSILNEGLITLKEKKKSITNLEASLAEKNRIEGHSSVFNIRLLSFKNTYKNLIKKDGKKIDATVDFYYENFEKLKISIFKYEFEPVSKNEVFDKYYFLTYRIIDKNDNSEPIVGVIAETEDKFENNSECEKARSNLISEYKNQKKINLPYEGINSTFLVSDSKGNNYSFYLHSSCSERIFSSKLSIVFKVLMSKGAGNYYTLLDLMGYKFKNNGKKFNNNNKIKF